MADFRFLAALAVLLGLLSFASPTYASHVQCGDVISQDVRLDSDLIGCPTQGLIIGADGVTLDLAGHVIRGEQVDESEAGISSKGHDNLVIRNGRIEDFQYAVTLEETTHSRMTSINARGLAGIRVSGNQNVVRRSAVNGSFFGLGVFGDNNLVRDNLISGPEVAANVGGTGGAVIANRIEGGSTGLSIRLENGLVRENLSTGAYYGYEIYGAGTRVVRNTASLNDIAGFYVTERSENIVLERNLATRAGTARAQPPDGTGIRVLSPTTTLTRNAANDNGAYGIYVVTTAIDGGRNTAMGNGIADCVNISCK